MSRDVDGFQGGSVVGDVFSDMNNASGEEYGRLVTNPETVYAAMAEVVWEHDEERMEFEE